MVWPFERGKLYSRRIDIHARYGGQQQGGIITPANYPLVVIVTGENGGQHGYDDRLRDDGVFEYFGMGQVGPMQMTAGNNAIANHSAAGESLLLFKKVADARLRFEGEWVCEAVQQRQAPDRNGDMRLAYVFELRPLENLDDIAPDAVQAGGLEELRRRAMAADETPVGQGPGNRNVYQRSSDVRSYVLARAGVKCEGCEETAPFNRPDGSPYLEPHHLRRLSDGGPDHPRFVIALCPTCHRRTHYAGDAQTYNTALIAKMQVIEPPDLQ